MFRRLHNSVWIVSVFCLGVLPATGQAIDWPQWLGRDRDGVWRETGLLTKFPTGGPKAVWRLPIGSGYSGPAVADGRVYVMDRERPKDASGKPARPTRAGVPGSERTLCLDAARGSLIWKDEYDCPYTISYSAGPRTTPLVRDGRVYTLGAMGDLRCLDSDSGKVRWAKKLMKDFGLDAPPVWGFAAHPLLDGDLLYCLVGGKGSAAVAFSKDTGKEVWRALTSEEVGYSPPMIYEAGGKRQLIIWLTDSVNSLDPATGKLYWTLPFPEKGQPQRPGVSIATVRKLGDLLLVSTYYEGSMMLKLAENEPAAKVLWSATSKNPEKPTTLHALMAAPFLKDGYVYGVSANGELCCLKADTGKLIWQTYAATGGKKIDCGTAFLVPQGDRFVIFNDHGDLILANLTPEGYHEIDRAHVLEPAQLARGRKVVWCHPAFAQRCIFARNDKEMICLSLAQQSAHTSAGS
jgi:outer membrane protein assembly factor BamB